MSCPQTVCYVLGRGEHGMMGAQREREGPKEVTSKGNICNRILNIVPPSLDPESHLVN